MENSQLQELTDLNSRLKKLEDTLSSYIQNKTLRMWDNVKPEKYKDILLVLLDDSPKDNSKPIPLFSTLVGAHILFHLHPITTVKNDCLDEAKSIKQSRSIISQAIRQKEVHSLPQLKTLVEEHEDRINIYIQAGSDLITALNVIRKITLQDLLRISKPYAATLRISDFKAFNNGFKTLSRISKNLPYPSHLGKRSLDNCLKMAEDIEMIVYEKEALLDDLKDYTNKLVMLLFNAHFFSPVSLVPNYIKTRAHSLLIDIESLNQTIDDIHKNLINSFSDNKLSDYLLRLDSQRSAVVKLVTDLSRQETFISSLDGLSDLVTEASVFLVHFDELSDAVTETVNNLKSSHNPDKFAAITVNKYYFETLWLMIKRSFSKPLKFGKISNLIKNCPVLCFEQKNDTNEEISNNPGLNFYLEDNLSDFEKSWVHTDVIELSKSAFKITPKT